MIKQEVEAPRGSEIAAILVMLLTVLALSAAAIWLVATEGQRHATFLGTRDRLRCLAEGVIDQALNRLGKHPWSARFYAAGSAKEDVAGLLEAGSYEGVPYFLASTDVWDGKSAQPGRTDLLVRLEADGQTLQLAALLAYNHPDVYHPRPYRILWMGETDPEPTAGMALTAVRNQLEEIEGRRKERRAWVRIIERAVGDILKAKATTIPKDLVSQLRNLNPKDRVNQESRFLQAFDEGITYYLGSGGHPARPEQAAKELEKAQDLASNMPTPMDRSANTASCLFARARALEWAAETPPASGDAAAARKNTLRSAKTMLGDILRQNPEAHNIPEALVELARCEFLISPDNTGINEADHWLQRLENEMPAYRPWECEWPSKSPDNNNLVQFLRGAMQHRLLLIGGAGAGDVWAVDAQGAIPLTRVAPQLGQPKERGRDLVGRGVDGTRIAFRTAHLTGATTPLRGFTMDFDGSRVREIEEGPNGLPGWVPPWLSDKLKIPAPVWAPSLEDYRAKGPQPLLASAHRSLLEALHSRLTEHPDATMASLKDEVGKRLKAAAGSTPDPLPEPQAKPPDPTPGGVAAWNEVRTSLAAGTMSREKAHQLLTMALEARAAVLGAYPPGPPPAEERQK